jgi:hypothetical protein
MVFIRDYIGDHREQEVNIGLDLLITKEGERVETQIFIERF